MPTETIFCPDCNHKLRVPEELMGEQVECPKCRSMFTAPPPRGAVLPADHPDAPPRRLPTRQVGGDDDPTGWDDVSPRRRTGPNPLPPGICLLVVAALGVLVSLFRIVMAVGFPNQLKQMMANNPFGAAMPAGLDMATIWLVSGTIFLLMSLASLAGSVALMTRRLWWLGILGCFTAIFNIGDFCCVLGLPVGIWGLIVLFNEGTRRTFQ